MVDGVIIKVLCRDNFLQNKKNDSFSIMGAKIWNSIPENLRNSSKSLFKEKVHATLLKIFEVQDRYADLNTIISDLKNY